MFHSSNTQHACMRWMAQEERADKLQLVATYNARLSEREYRRAFILDRGLLNVKRFQVRASVRCGQVLMSKVESVPCT